MKKCQDEGCGYHKAKRLDEKLQINWLPTPQLHGDKYKSFEEVYGSEPNDEYQPSKTKNTKERCLPQPSFPLDPTRARLIVAYTECNFPRLLYSRYSLKEQELKDTKRFFEENYYVCGCQLEEFPDIFQNPKINCFDPIHLHYYQCSSLKGYRNMCAKCLSSNPSVTHNKVNLCAKCHSPKLGKSVV